MGNLKRGLTVFLLAGTLTFAMSGAAQAVDTLFDNFDSYTDGATVDSVSSWKVTSGSTSNAVSASGTIFADSGKALKLIGASTPVKVTKTTSYSSSIAWVEMVIKPGIGNEQAATPSQGIASVTFDYTGKLLAADGKSWINTGKTFSTDQWLRVIFKLDFSTHRYDLYVMPAGTFKSPFTPDKENLSFIDTTINSMSKIGFDGAYHGTLVDDVYVDEIVLCFVKRLAITSSTQNIVKATASNAITVQLQSAGSEAQKAWKDIILNLKSSTSSGQFSLEKNTWTSVTQATIPKDSSEVTFYYKDTTSGKPTITVDEAEDRGWDSASQEITVVDEGKSFDVSVASPQIAGLAFDARITVLNDQGGTDTSYSGTVNVSLNYVSPASGTKVISPSTATGFVNGVLTVPLTYTDCGFIEIVVTDSSDSSKKGVSGQIQVTPNSFSVTTESTSQVVSKAFTLSVSALGLTDQITPNYQGPATVTAVPVSPATVTGASLLPAELVAANFVKGVAQVSMTYDRWGTAALKVSDKANTAITGTSGTLTFAPKAITLKVDAPPTGRDYFYVGETFKTTLAVNDELGNPIKNFSGKIKLSTTPTLDTIPLETDFVEADAGKKEFNWSATAKGSYVITATYGSMTAVTSPIQIKDASIEVISTVAPIGTTEVEIQLVDESGNRITSENSISIQILVDEATKDNSVFFSSPGKPIIFTKGLARVVIGNTQAETVTLSATSQYGFKIKSGTVTFGKIGTTGIGAVMYWEPKDE